MCKKRFNVSDLSCGLTWPHEKKFTRLNEWEPITLSHHSTWFVSSRVCGRRNGTFLICQGTPCDQVLKDYMTLCMGAPHPNSLCTKSNAYGFCERYHVRTWSIGDVTWYVEVSQPKSPFCQIWCFQDLWKWNDNDFYLLRWYHKTTWSERYLTWQVGAPLSTSTSYQF